MFYHVLPLRSSHSSHVIHACRPVWLCWLQAVKHGSWHLQSYCTACCGWLEMALYGSRLKHEQRRRAFYILIMNPEQHTGLYIAACAAAQAQAAAPGAAPARTASRAAHPARPPSPRRNPQRSGRQQTATWARALQSAQKRCTANLSLNMHWKAGTASRAAHAQRIGQCRCAFTASRCASEPLHAPECVLGSCVNPHQPHQKSFSITDGCHTETSLEEKPRQLGSTILISTPLQRQAQVSKKGRSHGRKRRRRAHLQAVHADVGPHSARDALARVVLKAQQRGQRRREHEARERVLGLHRDAHRHRLGAPPPAAQHACLKTLWAFHALDPMTMWPPPRCAPPQAWRPATCSARNVPGSGVWTS